MVSTGAALVVHDLKNELGALEARLEGLAQAPDAAAAALALRQCRSLRQRLVMYLTVYGHDGRLRAHAEDESPAELLESLAARHGVDFTLPGDAPPYWHYDRRLVAMAMDAALHNAQRFARQCVELSLRAEQGHLVLVVDDDGPGLDPARPPEASATGLGTALCRAVAQAHGTARDDGGVVLANRPQGGCRFELWLAT